MSTRNIYSISGGIHEAAQRGRRLGHWGTRTIDPNTVVSNDLQILRNRSLASARDNPWISRASTVGVAHEIGTGIVPRPNTSSEELNKQLREGWKDFTYYADYAGSLSVYGQQAMAARSRRESSEAFILIKRLRPSRASNLPLPLQFQVVEPDFCPLSFNKDHLPNGNKIITGVEVTKSGKPVAYWFYKQDPRRGHSDINNMVRIPVGDVIHHFKPTRPGQLRAIPEYTQALVKAHNFEEYNDAELERKKERAHFTGAITKDDFSEGDFRFDPMTGQPLETDAAGVPLLDLEPGTFPSLLPGEKIDLFEGDDAGRGYSDYQKWQLMGMSAGVDLPYQLISGDFADINDRLWRAIFNELKREIQQTQELYIIPQVCRIMWIEYVNRMIITGRVTIPPGMSMFEAYRCKHRPQAWEYIQPTQDVEADIKKVEAGFKSRSSVVDENNDDESAEDVDTQRKLDNDREDSLGLKPQEIEKDVVQEKPTDKPDKKST